jgi:hypothetical protein
VAESTKGVLLSAESSSVPANEGNVISPEDLGRKTAVSLLDEIYRVKFFLTRRVYYQNCCLNFTLF